MRLPWWLVRNLAGFVVALGVPKWSCSVDKRCVVGWLDGGAEVASSVEGTAVELVDADAVVCRVDGFGLGSFEE